MQSVLGVFNRRDHVAVGCRREPEVTVHNARATGAGYGWQRVPQGAVARDPVNISIRVDACDGAIGKRRKSDQDEIAGQRMREREHGAVRGKAQRDESVGVSTDRAQIAGGIDGQIADLRRDVVRPPENVTCAFEIDRLDKRAGSGTGRRAVEDTGLDRDRDNLQEHLRCRGALAVGCQAQRMLAVLEPDAAAEVYAEQPAA